MLVILLVTGNNANAQSQPFSVVSSAASSGSRGASDITIDTTTVTSGTSGRFLFESSTHLVTESSTFSFAPAYDANTARWTFSSPGAGFSEIFSPTYLFFEGTNGIFFTYGGFGTGAGMFTNAGRWMFGSTSGPADTEVYITNNATSDSIIALYDDAAQILRVADGGDFQYGRTVTAAATVGAQTINKAVGTVNFAATASSLVVTNALVSVTSIIFATVRTADATCMFKNVVPGAGSFTINVTAACTAETSVGFMVTN